MRTRARFVLLFALLCALAGASSIVAAYRAMGGELGRAEAELGAPAAGEGLAEARARDPALPAEERALQALAALDELRAAEAAAGLFRSQALVEAARRVGASVLAWTAAAALLFALASRPLARRLGELAAGALRASADRSFRFAPAEDPEFGPAFAAFNAMLDTIAEQETRLGEAARLEGWREVSSFLFHQLRSPLSALELASRNVSLACGKAAAGELDGERALESCASSASSASLECARAKALLERFKLMAGLSLGPPEALRASELAAACGRRLRPEEAALSFEGPDASLTGDRRMLEEALMNLIRNSAEACPAPPGRVLARARRAGGRVALEVSDGNGPVDPALPRRLGRERVSTKPEGTGLGLLFARRVAVLHGGELRVELGPDGGLVVAICLPDPAGAAP